MQIFCAPSFDDKILEVVAVFGSMQMAVSRVIKLQHHRIAQVSRSVKTIWSKNACLYTFYKSNPSFCLNQCRTVKITILGDEGVPIQVDGEAWIQPPGVIKIQHKNRAQMLTRDRVRKSRDIESKVLIVWFGDSQEHEWRDWRVFGGGYATRLTGLYKNNLHLSFFSSAFPCRHLRTHWSHGRTSWSMTSHLCGLTFTLSSLWIWLQRRRLPWCKCVPGRQKSSLQGKHELTWIWGTSLHVHRLYSLCFITMK